MVSDLASISNPTERLVRAVSRACSIVGNTVQLNDPELLVAARPDIWPNPSAIPTGRGPGGGPDGWNPTEVTQWFAPAGVGRYTAAASIGCNGGGTIADPVFRSSPVGQMPSGRHFISSSTTIAASTRPSTTRGTTTA